MECQLVAIRNYLWQLYSAASLGDTSHNVWRSILLAPDISLLVVGVLHLGNTYGHTRTGIVHTHDDFIVLPYWAANILT